MSSQPQKDLIIVETPFQLLCAYEYIETFQRSYSLVVRKTGRLLNDAQMESVLSIFDLKPDRILSFKVHSITALLKSIYDFRHFVGKKYGQLVLGSYFSRGMKALAKLVFRNGVLFIDDGTASLDMDRLLAQKKRPRHSAFSIYDLNQANYISYTKNTFHHLATRLKENSKTLGGVFIIGTGMVERIYDLENYLALIQYCVASAGQETVYYIPHRRQNPEYLDRIAAISGVEILQENIPIELLFMKKSIYPAKVFGTFSTALNSLAFIYPEAEFVSLYHRDIKPEFSDSHHAFVETNRDNPNLQFVTVE